MVVGGVLKALLDLADVAVVVPLELVFPRESPFFPLAKVVLAKVALGFMSSHVRLQVVFALTGEIAIRELAMIRSVDCSVAARRSAVRRAARHGTARHGDGGQKSSFRRAKPQFDHNFGLKLLFFSLFWAYSRPNNQDNVVGCLATIYRSNLRFLMMFSKKLLKISIFG